MELAGNASPDYLEAAREALAAGHTGQAQQSLEMAETRVLDRSVPPGQGNVASSSPAVARTNDALAALGAGNSAQAIKIIAIALAS